MPTTDNSSSASVGRSILSPRTNQTDPNLSGPHQSILDSFQNKIADRFSTLSGSEPDHFLTLTWIQTLLHTFLSSHEDFRLILLNTRTNKPPLDRIVQDFFDRSVKALDICNVIRDGIGRIRDWMKNLEIVLLALEVNNGNGNKNDFKVFGEGKLRRAKKALMEVLISMSEEKDSGLGFGAVAVGYRNRSFGRHSTAGHGHSRSSSWSVSRTWSVARQVQSIGSNLAAPRVSEVAATGGAAAAVYAMGAVLVVVMWVMVAAIPCQEKGMVQLHLNVAARGLPWAGAVASVQERVVEEGKRKERRNGACCCGLLKEVCEMERCVRAVGEVVDTVEFPLLEEKEEEVREKVGELRRVYDVLKDELDPLERQVREVFHCIVVSRTQGLDSVGKVE